MIEPLSFCQMKRVLENVVRTCRFYAPMTLPRIDISITIGVTSRLMYLRERIEDRIANIMYNLMGEDFCRLAIYCEESESNLPEREYDIEDYCVYIGIEGLLPFL